MKSQHILLLLAALCILFLDIPIAAKVILLLCVALMYAADKKCVTGGSPFRVNLKQNKSVYSADFDCSVDGDQVSCTTDHALLHKDPGMMDFAKKVPGIGMVVSIADLIVDAGLAFSDNMFGLQAGQTQQDIINRATQFGSEFGTSFFGKQI